jgi:septal ring factor EnvC (AmiA/AmiB activator)
MWFNFLTNVIMSKKANLLTTLAAATALSTAPVNANNLNNNPSLNNETKQVICETKLACDKLSLSIQAQIKEIEEKINLTTEDKRLRYELKKQLISVEKAETQINNELIADENQKQEIQQETIRVNEEIKAQLSSIKGSL